MTNNSDGIKAQPAAMVMTLEITRAETGKVEIVEVICTPIETEQTEQPKDQ